MDLPEVQSKGNDRDLKPVGKTRIESEPHPLLIVIAGEAVRVSRDIQGSETVIHP